MTRFVVVLSERKPEGRIAIHGPFRAFATAEARAQQLIKRVNALNLDVAVYVERLAPSSESITDLLEAWHG